MPADGSAGGLPLAEGFGLAEGFWLVGDDM
jgi:hypothetical protein